MTLRIALMTTVLVVISVASCTAVEVVEVSPRCTPPPQPTLPLIDRGALWDALGDTEYRRLESYTNGLWGWADEQAAMLDVLCGTGPAGG